MNKLTFKDIAKYLPYKVKLHDTNSPTNTALHINVSTLHFLEMDDYKPLIWNKCLPILRPLSQLIEEIQHEGKRFVPIMELIKFVFGDYVDDPIYTSSHEEDIERYKVNVSLSNGSVAFGVACYENQCDIYSYLNNNGSDEMTIPGQERIFQKLYEWHFWTGDQSYFEKGILIEK